MSTKNIILFDGICNLCNGLVDFILKRDKKGRFRLIPIQSEKGQSILNDLNIEDSALKTVFYLRKDKLLTESTAVLYILKDLKGAWQLLFSFIIFPPFIRDSIYRIVSKHRYKWFGKRDTCRII